MSEVLFPEVAKLREAILSQTEGWSEAQLAVLDAGLAALNLVKKAEEAIEAGGLTVQGDRGGVKANPLLAVLRDARSQFLIAMKLLHLNLDEMAPKQVGRPTAYERFAAGKGW